MNYICLADFRQLADAIILNQPPEPELIRSSRGISIDSRSLKANQIFWALKGAKYDAHDFIIDAVKNGAAAVVIDRKHAHVAGNLGVPAIVVPDTLLALQKMAALHRKKFDIPVLAITGTNGKTTTKEMLAWILHSKYNVHRTWGNLNNHIGVPLTLLHLTTAHQISIIEMGTNHPGEIALLGSLVEPTAGLITNIGRGHLQFFKNIKGVAREKLDLFRCTKSHGLLIVNKDDLYLGAYSSSSHSFLTYSFQDAVPADVQGKFIGLNDGGAGIWELNRKVVITMQVTGQHNARNALAASAAALYFGMHEEEIKEMLEKYHSYEKRMQIIRNGNWTIINDSYNANPDSFMPALETLLHMAKKQSCRKILVLGDMLELGKTSQTLHLEILQQAHSCGVNGIFTVGEFFHKAVKKFKVKTPGKIYSFLSHQELATALKKFIKTDDIILIKGSRGMQMEKILSFL
jgi:UDP-N-acetylmuramoyl-tripeptide--D-alanyl-D-alanine ligase